MTISAADAAGARLSEAGVSAQGDAERPAAAQPVAQPDRQGGTGEAGSDRLVVVANRLPLEARQLDDGTTRWERSPGGLVSALEPVLASRPSTWVGWSGRFSDETEPDAAGVPENLSALGECELHEIPLDRAEVEAYYDGFSNAALWPLYHDAIVSPSYDRQQFEAYRAVNRRFADKVAQLAGPGATVWVHDYQLQLVPGLLREQRPDLKIGFFLHIPFPPVELYLQMPWRAVILNSLLGADVVGFQTSGGARNFLHLAERLLGLTVEGDDVLVEGAHGPRRVRAGAYPISIDSDAFDALARDPRTRKRVADTRRALGNPELMLLGVDRLDYTKGIDIRIQAVAELLEEGQLDPARTVFVQVATPSRENVEEYQVIRDEVELIVGRAMGAHGQVGVAPIRYLHQPVPREDLVALYAAADIMLVTPLRDGMNLVCKEYVATRINDDGALVLSEFTGAAGELTEAWMVNPYDADGMKESIVAAATASPQDRARRMRALREQVFSHDVEAWARSFLDTLEEVTAGRTA